MLCKTLQSIVYMSLWQFTLWISTMNILYSILIIIISIIAMTESEQKQTQEQ